MLLLGWAFHNYDLKTPRMILFLHRILPDLRCDFRSLADARTNRHPLDRTGGAVRDCGAGDSLHVFC